MKPDCLFCKIIAGEIPCYKIAEDNHYIAILDINPNNLGHSLVIPKTHSRNILDIQPDDLCHLGIFAQKIAQMVKSGVSADGINLWMNNEPAADQLIMHSHLHIIPRFAGDKVITWKEKIKYTDADFKAMQEKIKVSL